MVILNFLAFSAAVGFGMYLGVKTARNEMPFEGVAKIVREFTEDSGKQKRKR